MFKTFEEDRPFIERKYHDPEKPFDPYKRRMFHGWEGDPSTGKTDEEILALLREKKEEWKDLSHPVQKALAVDLVLKNTRIDVNEHDYFIQFYSWGQLADSVTFKPWKEEVFSEKIPEIRDEMAQMCDTGSATIWPDFDHVVPDWDSLLSLGFPGIIARAEEYRRKKEAERPLTGDEAAFFDGIRLEYGAILSFLDRLIELASRRTHAKARRVEECLRDLRAGAPKNTFEAMQLMYLYFMVSESAEHYQVRSLGNGLDHSLAPFFERDLAEGTFTIDELREFFAYFFMQWSAIGNYWGQPFYLAGTNADGSSRVCRTTYEIVKVYRALKIYNPKIQVKVNANTPREFIDLVFDCIRGGSSSFVFCCEENFWRAIMRYGATPEEAREFDIRGCYETGVRADEVCTVTGYLNCVKPVLYALRDGADEKTGEQVGPHTGKAEDLKTYEDFYAAFLAQFRFQIARIIRVANSYDPYMAYINPSSLYSATVKTALENAFDGYQGGVKYNNSNITCCSFASCVDSLMAIREFVFEKKEITLPALRDLLDRNFEGGEALRARILKSRRKFGNGDREVDRVAQGVADTIVAQVAGRPNGRGGVYKPLLHSAMQFVRQGKKTGATPDGRLDGAELSKNASPVAGMDREGVTALLHSVIALTPSQFSEGCCLDVFLHPSAVEGEDGLAAMRAILDTYRKEGGLSVQFNLFDAATLEDARIHPEKYRGLQVRVCGWNVLWNNLSPEEQEAYLVRARAL